MKKCILFILILPALMAAQTELGSFVFLDDSRATHLTGLLGLSGASDFTLGIAREASAPELLEFMNFIPGYAMKYTIAYSGDLLLHASLITRARYQPRRKVIGVFGIGIGAEFGRGFTPYPNIVLGVDYLLSDRWIVTAALEGGGLLTIGLGRHRDYGW